MSRPIIIVFILFLTLNLKSQDFCGFIQNVQAYQDAVKLKEIQNRNILDPNTFDIEHYLSFFDNITIEKGYKIDVYYMDRSIDGYPYLYAIKKHKFSNKKNINSLEEILNQPENRAKNHIFPKDSKLGYLQFLFFYKMGEQFALYWHANYGECRIVCTKNKIDAIIEELTISKDFLTLPKELSKLKDINPEIKIEYDDKYCNITWIEYRTHSGIYQCTYQIERNGSYEIKRTSEIVLVHIDIGFIY